MLGTLEPGDRLLVQRVVAARPQPLSGDPDRGDPGPAQDPLHRHQGGHRVRRQAGPADQGDDRAVRIVCRGRAGPDLRTNQGRTSPLPKPRGNCSAGPRGPWEHPGSTASSKTSGRCWARMSPRPRSPRYWTSPAPPSTTSSRPARSLRADPKARTALMLYFNTNVGATLSCTQPCVCLPQDED